MSLRGCVLAVLIAACMANGGIGPAGAQTSRLLATVDLPCAGSVLQQPASWYLPVSAPRGLVWLQHGFARDDANVAALAESLSDAGYLVFAPSLPFVNVSGCTLQNLGDNTQFLNGVAQLFATAGDPGGPLARSLATAATRTGRTAPALPTQFVFVGHSAGAEAAEYVAYRLHATAGWNGLRGLVLLDPVESFLGDNTDRALTDLDPTTVPVLTISGPPGLCNNFGSGTAALQTRLHRSFVGVRLPSGEHTDAEGTSTDILGQLACGIPQQANVTTLQHLTTGWTSDFFTGAHTASLYPAARSGVVAAAPAAQSLGGA